MSNYKQYRYTMIILLLVTASLACNLVTSIGERANQVRKAGEEVSTAVSKSGILDTAQAFATQQGPQLEMTIQALATREGPKVEQTLQAVATQQGPGIQATAQAMITQAPELLETAHAAITQNEPGLLETARAFATQAASPSQEAPDIPLISGSREHYVSTKELVTYGTPVDFKTVLDFYQKQMPVSGWTKVDEGTVISSNAAVLNYEKPDRKATITLTTNPLDKTTLVVIVIQAK